jgi:hypothetical protein
MFERLLRRKKSEQKRPSPREEAARRQIERQLQDSRISPQDRERLTWRMDRLGKQERHELSAKERLAAAEHIHELLNSKTGDALRKVIQKKLFQGEANQHKRDENVAHAGYDPGELRRIGQETITRVDDLNTRMNERKAMIGDDITDSIKLNPLVYSKRGDTKLRHSDLTVGASVVLRSHMQKMIAVGLEDDMYKRKGMIGSQEPPVTIETIRQYVNALDTDRRGVEARQETAIAGLDESEKTQYRFAGSLLGMPEQGYERAA